ncbi:unnamed protein product [Boreogadus saida]
MEEKLAFSGNLTFRPEGAAQVSRSKPDHSGIMSHKSPLSPGVIQRYKEQYPEDPLDGANPPYPAWAPVCLFFLLPPCPGLHRPTSPPPHLVTRTTPI